MAAPTEHGLQLEQAAGEVVEVDEVLVGVSGDQHLMQLVVQSEACGHEMASRGHYL